MDKPEVIANIHTGQSTYPETAQVFFGKHRYFLLHSANQRVFSKFLEVKGHRPILEDQGYWSFDNFFSSLSEESGDISEEISDAALSDTFYEVRRPHILASDHTITSQKTTALIERIISIKKSEPLASNNKPSSHQLDVKKNPEMRNKKLSETVQESGKTAIALATGGASLGAIIGGLPGAILGGALGGLITFSSDRHKRDKRG